MKRMSVEAFLATTAVVVFAFAFFNSEAFARDARLNLILGDGTVMIYQAAQAGYVEGQTLSVIRGGEVVGTVVISSAFPAYAKAIIVSGSDSIQEYDVVMPAEQETARPAKLPTATTTPAATYNEINEGFSDAPPERTEVAPASMPDESEYESSPSARRDSRRDSSRDSETAIAMASAAQAEPQAAPPVQATSVKQLPPRAIASRSSSYAFHAGYLFFNQSVPGAVSTSSDPALLFGLDYWRPKKDFRSVVYNISYSQPETINRHADWQSRSKYEILQLSANYVWSAFDSKHFGSAGLYWGVGVSYARASAQTNCEGACGGILPEEEAIEGIGYQGLVGYRFGKNYELKLDYRFDKDYFAITFGMGGKRKRVAMMIEAPPEPVPEIVVEPEPEPLIIEEPEPEPEPIAQKDVWTYSDFEKPAPEPIVIIVSEPEVEKTVYYYATQPEIEKKVIIIALEDVFFDFDKSELTLEARAILKRNIQILKENPRIRIRIAGYTSASGSDDYNQKLSERRAKAVKEYLVQEGLISSDRLVTIGFGESNPAIHEAAPKDLYSKSAKANMRVLFEIIVK